MEGDLEGRYLTKPVPVPRIGEQFCVYLFTFYFDQSTRRMLLYNLTLKRKKGGGHKNLKGIQRKQLENHGDQTLECDLSCITSLTYSYML